MIYVCIMYGVCLLFLVWAYILLLKVYKDMNNDNTYLRNKIFVLAQELETRVAYINMLQAEKNVYADKIKNLNNTHSKNKRDW